MDITRLSIIYVSEGIRRVCRKYGMKVIFRSELSLRSVLTRVKDPLPMEKWSKVVYRIPCVAARSTSVRPEEGWRQGWGSTRRPTGKGHWRSLQWLNMYGRTSTPSSEMRPRWLTWPDTPMSCFSRKPSTSTWPLLRNASTETQVLSSLDAGWLPWEDKEAGPGRHPLMDLPRIPQTPVTVNDATYGHKMTCSHYMISSPLRRPVHHG